MSTISISTQALKSTLHAGIEFFQENKKNVIVLVALIALSHMVCVCGP